MLGWLIYGQGLLDACSEAVVPWGCLLTMEINCLAGSSFDSGSMDVVHKKILR